MSNMFHAIDEWQERIFITNGFRVEIGSISFYYFCIAWILFMIILFKVIFKVFKYLNFWKPSESCCCVTFETFTGKFVSSSQQDVLLKQNNIIGFCFIVGCMNSLVNSFSKLKFILCSKFSEEYFFTFEIFLRMSKADWICFHTFL